MNEQSIVDIAANTVWVTIQVATPSLVAALIIGLLVSIFQAATQINEQTLSFIPKVMVIFAAFIFFGPWIIKKMMEFTVLLYQNIGSIHG